MVSDPPEGSDEDKTIDLLADVISDYEKRTVTLPKISPAELIRCVMENRGLKQEDLIPFIGSETRVSEFLTGKSELTLEMGQALAQELRVPLNALYQEH